MEHTVFYHDNAGDFRSNMPFKCGSMDIFEVIASFEKQFPHRKVVSVTMYDGVQWIKREFVGWETF